jgi:GNAT superfamily N-acetyltransferase
MIDFYLAKTDEDYAAARLLFSEYAQAININLDFQHFDEELDGLKKMYAPPYGGIILAKDAAETIGCVAIRKISVEAGELKRMYIQPNQQQKGIGKILLEKALQLAKDSHYKVVKLDTLNYMLPAIHLYKQAGFYEIAAYYHNPISTAVYFEKQL